MRLCTKEVYARQISLGCETLTTYSGSPSYKGSKYRLKIKFSMKQQDVMIDVEEYSCLGKGSISTIDVPVYKAVCSVLPCLSTRQPINLL